MSRPGVNGSDPRREDRSANAASAWPLTIYYDASCPLCRTEIGTLMARTPPGRLALVDCSPATFSDAACAAEGVTRAALMSRIHARDAQGRWLRGIDVFAAVYRAAGLTALARLYENRLLRPWLDRLYPWVADHRQFLSRLGLARAFRLIAPPGAQGAACPGGTCAVLAHPAARLAQSAAHAGDMAGPSVRDDCR